jgi:hypothetical protein
MNGRKVLNKAKSPIGKFVLDERKNDILKDFKIFFFVEFSCYRTKSPAPPALKQSQTGTVTLFPLVFLIWI